MLKACRYCGGIHPKGLQCPKHKPVDYTKKDEAYDFRNSVQWQRKRDEIKERDLHLCQACLNKLSGTVRQYNSEKLEVHHIQKLRTNWKKRFDNDNLITLCIFHHKQADSGKISAKTLQNIILSKQNI